MGIFESLFEGHEYSWQALQEIESFISSFGNLPQSQEYKEIMQGVFIGKNVKIDSTAKIEGMAIIGHNSMIGHAAFVREGALVGENVKIRHAVEVKHSILLNSAQLAHLNYVGDSVIGCNVNLSGGAITANTRLDLAEVKIRDGENIISTGLLKLGSIMGDGCFIGAGCVTNPGTVLGRNCKVYPLASVRGTYPQDSRIK